MRAFLAFALLATACDTRAQPAAAAPGGAPLDPDRMSKELESCSRTADCAEGLRCFENECRRTDRNVVGDYDAALGANKHEGGDLAGALAAYADAAKAYDDKPPVDIDCAYGAALADARADKEKAELAARVLHRCVNVSPAGSPMREAALREIAMLDSVGLDPQHLAKTEPADVYLSKAPAAPKSANLQVSVSAAPEPPAAAKSWAATQDAIKAERDALVACWQKSFDSSHAAALTVGVPVKSSYHDSGYDDEPGFYATAIDPKAAAPANDAEKCVRDAVTAALKNVKVGGADWASTVTVTVQ
jgi:hypothetical protein